MDTQQRVTSFSAHLQKRRVSPEPFQFHLLYVALVCTVHGYLVDALSLPGEHSRRREVGPMKDGDVNRACHGGDVAVSSFGTRTQE